MIVETCSRIGIPLRCMIFTNRMDSTEINDLLTRSHGPIFLIGYDDKLSLQLSKAPLLAGERQRLWVMPLDYEKDIQLCLDSRVFFYKKLMSNSYIVYEGYAINGVKHISPLFEWFPSKSDHIKVFKKEVVLQRRSNLNGVELITDYPAEVDPFVKYVRDRAGVIVQVDGYYTDILNDLEEHFKFSIK